MKICFVSKKFNCVGGIEKITCDLSNALQEKNIDVFLLQLDKNNNVEYNCNKEVKKITLKTKEKHKILILIKLWWFLVKNKINCLIIQNMNLGYFTYLRKLKLTKTKIIFVDHSSLNHYISNNIENEIIKRQKYTKYADKVVALTSDNLRAYTTYLKLNGNKVTSIPNFTSHSANNVLYNVKSKTIVAIGRLDNQKRFDLLIKSFKLVNELYPDWNLEIYGDGPKKDELQALINKHNLNENCLLKGNYSSLDNALRGKSFLVASSEYEGFGIMLLEGLVYKLPLVSFDCYSGPSEMIMNDFNGYLCKKLDIFDLADKMKKLIGSESLRIKMSENSQEIYKKFEKENVVQQWFKLFSSL